MKKKCLIPPLTSPSSSSSSSSSCIVETTPIAKNLLLTPQKAQIPPKVEPKKRARVANSATSPPKSRSSMFRGVTRHRWTGRYEAHLWDKSTWNSISNKRGRQIYLGAYDNEEDAARTYDLAALKYWGPISVLNFPVDTYTKDLEEMENLTKEEFLATLRRRSSGFSRGVSKYRGVARHHHNGRWEARIGRVTGNKYLYLGTYNTQEEAAAAYDMAAIEYRGPHAVTNFDISHYAEKLKHILPAMQVKEKQLQVKEEIAPDSFDMIQPNEARDHQDDFDNQVHASIPKLELIDSNYSPSMVIMAPTEARNQVRSSIPKLELIDSNDSLSVGMMGPINAHNQVQSIIPKLELIDSNDSQSMVMMDPTEAHEHPWDLCLDMGFNALDIPDLPLESELMGLYDDKGFIDDIDFIFDGTFDCELLQDAISGTSDCQMEADLSGAQELKEAGVSHSPSSSSLSTMTSVSSSG